MEQFTTPLILVGAYLFLVAPFIVAFPGERFPKAGFKETLIDVGACYIVGLFRLMIPLSVIFGLLLLANPEILDNHLGPISGAAL